MKDEKKIEAEVWRNKWILRFSYFSLFFLKYKKLDHVVEVNN